MKLNTNITNLIILSIILFSSISFITSEPTRYDVTTEESFNSLKYRNINLKVNDELMICIHYGSNIKKRMYDHDKILETLSIKDDCYFYRAVKAGKLEILFEKSHHNQSFFSIRRLVKEFAEVLLFINYKKWDVAVSE